MAKGKIAAKAIKEATKNIGRGAKVGGAAVVAERAVDVLESKPLSAAEGALIGGAAGSVFGPPGAIAGGIVGGGLGWILADSNTVFPVDMVCIPAYQSYMIQGQPAFTVYARAGETIVPTGGNVQDVKEAIMEVAPVTKRTKKTGWHRYMKQKKNQIKFKSGKMKGRLNLKAMAKAYKKGRK